VTRWEEKQKPGKASPFSHRSVLSVFPLQGQRGKEGGKKNWGRRSEGVAGDAPSPLKKSGKRQIRDDSVKAKKRRKFSHEGGGRRRGKPGGFNTPVGNGVTSSKVPYRLPGVIPSDLNGRLKHSWAGRVELPKSPGTNSAWKIVSVGRLRTRTGRQPKSRRGIWKFLLYRLCFVGVDQGTGTWEKSERTAGGIRVRQMVPKKEAGNGLRDFPSLKKIKKRFRGNGGGKTQQPKKTGSLK